jgi:acyl-coenzyme A synthetase/AMP-(fatty) acid ligase
MSCQTWSIRATKERVNQKYRDLTPQNPVLSEGFHQSETLTKELGIPYDLAPLIVEHRDLLQIPLTVLRRLARGQRSLLYMNITKAIWRNCYAYPDRIAVQYEGHPVSYKALRTSVELASSRLAAAGVGRGDVVAISPNNRLTYLVALLAAVRIGAVATPFPSGIRETLVARNHVHSVVLEKEDRWRSGTVPLSQHLNIEMLLKPLVDGEKQEVPPIARGLDQQAWFIALSSGTTGAPKSNPHTHAEEILTLNLSQRVNQDDQERVLVFISLGVYFGVNMVMRQLYAGMTTVLGQSLRPEDFYRTVQRDRATRVVTTTGTASDLVTYAEAKVADSKDLCASIRSFMVAGDAVSSGLRKGITDRICEGVEALYGTTEVGALALATRGTVAAHPRSAGRLYSWIQAETVDEDDQPLPEGKPGLLRFRSPALTSGYIGDEDATNKAFRNGWFYPGDAGVVGIGGYLFLTGRADHVLNLGGNKVDPDPIERLLREQPTIIDCVAVAADGGMGRQILVAVVEATEEVKSEALKALCLDRLGKLYVPHAILRVDALPRNEGGKVMRAALASRIRISDKKRSADSTADDSSGQ